LFWLQNVAGVPVVAGIPAVSSIPAVPGVLTIADIARDVDVYAFAGITLLRRSRHAITKKSVI
jgi:hypothetical protein